MKTVELTKEQAGKIFDELCNELNERCNREVRDNEFTLRDLMERTDVTHSTGKRFLTEKIKAGIIYDTGRRTLKGAVIYGYVKTP